MSDMGEGNEIFISYIPVKSEIELLKKEEPLFKSEKLYGEKAKELIKFLNGSILPHARYEYTQRDIKRSISKQVLRILQTKNTETKLCMLENLMIDFLDNGTATQMRAEGKYIIGIYYENVLILMHTKLKEKSLVKKEDNFEEDSHFELYERFLDKDNIYRFVIFYLEDGKLVIKVYLRQGSHKKSLEWLGIPENKYPLPDEFVIRFIGRYGDYKLAVELDSDTLAELEKNLSGGISKIKDITLNLNDRTIKIGDLKMRIEYILIPSIRRRINPEEIIKLFNHLKEINYDLEYQRKFIEQLIHQCKTKKESLIGIVQYKPYIEKIDGLYENHPKQDKIILPKPNSNTFLIYAHSEELCKYIKLDEEFLDELAERIINNEPIEILILNGNINYNTPIRIGNLVIYNHLPYSEILQRFDEISKTWDTLSRFYKSLLNLTLLDLLTVIDQESFYVFNVLLEYIGKYKNLGEFDNKPIPEIESFIEFKGRQLFYKPPDFKKPNRIENIVNKLIEDIPKKIQKSNTGFVMYIIGVDKESRKIEPIQEEHFGDDLIRDEIYKPIKEKMLEDSIIITEPKKIPIKGGFILVFTAKTL